MITILENPSELYKLELQKIKNSIVNKVDQNLIEDKFEQNVYKNTRILSKILKAIKNPSDIVIYKDKKFKKCNMSTL